MESSIIESVQSAAEDLSAVEESRETLSNSTFENHPKENLAKKRKKKRTGNDRPDEPSSSSCSSYSTQKWQRLGNMRRKPRVSVGSLRHSGCGDVAAIALPLGMSFAAVVTQVKQKSYLSLKFRRFRIKTAAEDSGISVWGYKLKSFGQLIMLRQLWYFIWEIILAKLMLDMTVFLRI